MQSWQRSVTLKYLIKLPKEEHQCHHMGEVAGFIEPLVKRINTYLKSLVKCGCRRIKSYRIQRKLVTNTILAGEKNWAMFRDHFCTSRRKLKSIITIVKLEDQFWKNDRKNNQHLNKGWKQLGNKSFSPK